MISLKNPEQIGKMRDAGALLYEVLCRLRDDFRGSRLAP